MHIAEVVTIAKSLPLLRLNTYKSLILSYSADYRRIFYGKRMYDMPDLVNQGSASFFFLVGVNRIGIYGKYVWGRGLSNKSDVI